MVSSTAMPRQMAKMTTVVSRRVIPNRPITPMVKTSGMILGSMVIRPAFTDRYSRDTAMKIIPKAEMKLTSMSRTILSRARVASKLLPVTRKDVGGANS